MAQTNLDRPLRIYVASSWRNDRQPGVVRLLRSLGLDVYDFKNPPNGTGFAWEEVDPEFKTWSPSEFRNNLDHPRAQEGYNSDASAMAWADAGVLVLESRKSAHLEAGWLIGSGKPTAILLAPGPSVEPELMYLLAGPTNLLTSSSELASWAGRLSAQTSGVTVPVGQLSPDFMELAAQQNAVQVYINLARSYSRWPAIQKNYVRLAAVAAETVMLVAEEIGTDPGLYLRPSDSPLAYDDLGDHLANILNLQGDPSEVREFIGGPEADIPSADDLDRMYRAGPEGEVLDGLDRIIGETNDRQIDTLTDDAQEGRK